jgi:hypothetical protein
VAEGAARTSRWGASGSSAGAWAEGREGEDRSRGPRQAAEGDRVGADEVQAVTRSMLAKRAPWWVLDGERIVPIRHLNRGVFWNCGRLPTAMNL